MCWSSTSLGASADQAGSWPEMQQSRDTDNRQSIRLLRNPRANHPTTKVVGTTCTGIVTVLHDAGCSSPASQPLGRRRTEPGQHAPKVRCYPRQAEIGPRKVAPVAPPPHSFSGSLSPSIFRSTIGLSVAVRCWFELRSCASNQAFPTLLTDRRLAALIHRECRPPGTVSLSSPVATPPRPPCRRRCRAAARCLPLAMT